MNYGEKIKKLRIAKNLTQAKLAEKLYISDKTVSSWENNRTEPSLEFILKLSEILECDVKDLISKNEKNSNLITSLKFKINYKKYKYLNSYLDVNAKKNK